MDTFSTKSTSLYSQKVNEPLIIEEGGMTRRVFFADTNDKKLENGETVSGTIVHQRKKKNDDWEDVESINLTSLKGGEGVKIKFDSSQLKKFYDGLSKIYALANQGVNLGANEYIVGKTDEIISVSKNRKQQIESLLEENLGEDIWEELIRSNPDLATKFSLAKIQNDRKIVLEEFKNSLDDEEKKEEFWQSFFTKNDWIFGYGLQYKFLKTDTDQPNYGGENYKGKGKQKGDFLTYSEAKNAKFTVLVEIKKPHTDLLAKKPKTGDRVRYRNGAWLLGSEVFGGVSQLQINCKSWQRTSDEPQNRGLIDENIFTIQPKGILVIGSTVQFGNQEQTTSFELFRKNLSNIEIITFDELYERAAFIVEKTPQEAPMKEEPLDNFPF